MAHIEFTPHLARHVDCPPREIEEGSLRAALEQVFQQQPRLRGYILEDHGAIRQHVAVFVDGVLLHDRVHWDVPLQPDSRVYVMQALSGG